MIEPATEDSVNRSSTADNGSSSGTSHTCSHGRHATSARAVAQSALDISPRSTPGFSSNDIGGSSPELVAVDTRDSSPELNPIATGDSSPELVSADTRDSSSELNPINTGENSEASPTCTALVLYQEISHLPTHGFGHNSESVGTGSQSANLIAHNARITSILDLPNEILYQILRSSDAGPSQCGALVATCKRFESVLSQHQKLMMLVEAFATQPTSRKQREVLRKSWATSTLLNQAALWVRRHRQ